MTTDLSTRTGSPDPTPMTDEELAAIREDYAGVDEDGSVPRLLAEVDRLRDELTESRQRYKSMCDRAARLDETCAKVERERNAAKARIADLNSRLAESEARRKDLFRRLGEHMDDLGDANTALTKMIAERDAALARIEAAAADALEEARDRLTDQAERVRTKFGRNQPGGHNRVYGLQEAASMLAADAKRARAASGMPRPPAVGNAGASGAESGGTVRTGVLETPETAQEFGEES